MDAYADQVTIGAATFSVLGFFSLFVSSKPVTFAAVLMTLAVSACVSQVAVSVGSVGNSTVPMLATPTAGSAAVEYARSAASRVYSYLLRSPVHGEL
jgi:hypothetical protein